MIPPDVASALRVALIESQNQAQLPQKASPVAPTQRITDALSNLVPGQPYTVSLTHSDGATLTGGGMVDVYRQLQPTATDAAYTWWSNRGQAYAKNVGWRLDYHLATPTLAALARSEHLYKDVKFSDHAPITVDYDLTM